MKIDLTKKETRFKSRYEKKINRLNKFSFFSLNFINKYEKLLSFYSSFNITSTYSKLLLAFTDKYEKFLIEKSLFARVSTMPTNYYLYRMLKKLKKSNVDPLLFNGVHFITALMGGGKSSLIYDVIEEIRRNTGKSSYVNADFEKIKYDDVAEKSYLHHQKFELTEFFDMSNIKKNDEETGQIKISQKKKFNRNFDSIVLDEWLSEMNHRNNKKSDYNNIFLALMNMIAHMRHQKMKRIFVLSQMSTTDVQLMTMFSFIHEIQVDLDCTYLDWIKTGSLSKKIKGWWISTYAKPTNKKYQNKDEMVLIKKYYRKATADFTYFDTFSMASRYDNLPEDKIAMFK
jgi:hypothetical protein